MKATIDREGRIALTKELQDQLGVQPGDEVLVENHGREWVIKAAKDKAGLCQEGNVLVHCGTTAMPNIDPLATVREERSKMLCKGLLLRVSRARDDQLRR